MTNLSVLDGDGGGDKRVFGELTVAFLTGETITFRTLEPKAMVVGDTNSPTTFLAQQAEGGFVSIVTANVLWFCWVPDEAEPAE